MKMRHYIVVAQVQHEGKERHSIAGTRRDEEEEVDPYVVSLSEFPTPEDLSTSIAQIFLRVHNLLYGEKESKEVSEISIEKIGLWEVGKPELEPSDLEDLNSVGMGSILPVYDKEFYSGITFAGIKERL